MISNSRLFFLDSHAKPVALSRPKTKVSFYQEPKVKEGEKRKINYQIQKNKGLTKKRSKEYRNSRVKLKNKYNKALKKIRGLQPGVKDMLNPVSYGGEASGINMNVVKSVSLKSV